ncbi:MAG TPA: glycosyltransferase family 2 protein [Nitrospinota bacterium]|nr:glycosyltransferase family 2 protein [Nitrospinota bacterium]
MKGLTVTVITYNEEENIRASLESVKWADEIVIIDSYSNDNTVKICKEYTEKIFFNEWLGFGLQKNLCIDKASCDWILNLDADERITSELREEIADTLSQENSVDGYYIPRKNFFDKKWIRYGGWYPDYNLRLFKKNKGRFKERQVHEKIDLNGKAGYLKNPLEHHTYKNITDFLKRMNKYSTLSAEELYKNKKKVSYLDIMFRPPFTFLKMYILKRGFLDGYLGFLLALLYSFYTFAKYIKLKELYENA